MGLPGAGDRFNTILSARLIFSLALPLINGSCVAPSPSLHTWGSDFTFRVPASGPGRGGAGWGRVPYQPGRPTWQARGAPAPVPQYPLALPAGLKDLSGKVALLQIVPRWRAGGFGRPMPGLPGAFPEGLRLLNTS